MNKTALGLGTALVVGLSIQIWAVWVPFIGPEAHTFMGSINGYLAARANEIAACPVSEPTPAPSQESKRRMSTHGTDYSALPAQTPTAEKAALEVADFWLKIRVMAEQRANWYYVALFAGLAAVLSGYEKLVSARRFGTVVVLGVGAAGLLGGFGVGAANFYDMIRANCIAIALSAHPGARAVGLTAIAGRANDYLISVLSMFAGSVYWILMCCLAYKLTDSKEPQGSPDHLG